jgi:hypothetical protein
MHDARSAARLKRALANRAAGATHDLAAHQKQKKIGKSTPATFILFVAQMR